MLSLIGHQPAEKNETGQNLIPLDVSQDENNMLNLSQKRSLGIALGIVEDELRHLGREIRQGEQQNLFSHIVDDLKGKKRFKSSEKSIA